MSGDSYNSLGPNFVNVQAPQGDVFSGYRVWVNVSGGYFDGYAPTMLHLDPDNFEVTITSDPPADDAFVILDSMSPPPPNDSFIFTPVEVHLDSANRDDRIVSVTLRYLDFEETVAFPVLAYASGGNNRDVVVIVDHATPYGAESFVLSRTSIRHYAETERALQMIFSRGTVLIDAEAVGVIGEQAVDERIDFELVSLHGELALLVTSGDEAIADLESMVKIIQPSVSD